MEKEDFISVIRGIPKSELHLHLEDFISGHRAPVGDLSQFVSFFRSVQDSVREMEDFECAFTSLAEYMRANGVIYAEVFVSPGRYLRNGMSYPQLVRFFEQQLKNIRRGQEFNVKLLVDVSRSHGVEKAMDTLDLVIKHPSEAIIGIGLGGDEVVGKCRDFKPVFDKARAAGLRCTAHAGESVDAWSVLDAIQVLKAERIGHATSAIQDEAVMNLIVNKQIPIEVQLTSNLITGKFVTDLKKHPIKQYLKCGALVTLNSDDPTLFNTDICREFWRLYKYVGCNMEQILNVIINGFRASFLPESKKDEYIKNVKKRWTRHTTMVNKPSAKWRQSVQSVFESVEY